MSSFGADGSKKKKLAMFNDDSSDEKNDEGNEGDKEMEGGDLLDMMDNL